LSARVTTAPRLVTVNPTLKLGADIVVACSYVRMLGVDISFTFLFNYLQYLITTGSTLTAIGPFQLPAPKSGTLFQILSGTRPSAQLVSWSLTSPFNTNVAISETKPSAQTLSDICLKRTCSLDTSAFSALEVLDDNHALQIYLLTYLLATVHCRTI